MAVPIRERSQFKVGKYDVIAQPVQGSAQMLRYTVMLGGKRLGALLSVPTESDCKFIESPPPVPPLKIFYVTSRPGRPKKNAARPPLPAPESPARGLRQEDLPAAGLPLDIERAEHH
ncbi:MAG: hypothetical protein A3D95_08045 [Betaproteobacteria bacterium RIFCSPHIGHO2_12_FULL_69_13]|nr:MAG: hypothetical protein A3D95_08045 [Betaproteobacteria bacterium RIFCSPHIGHO2_12_FULL_69_13]OGA67443.1 MAG: hypothetical protein A3G83_17685 [Betaproteobacteria bacterium RIFCSPLOWO2_12_FULL_68_20]